MKSVQCSVCELLGDQTQRSTHQPDQPCPVCKKSSTQLPEQWRDQILALPMWLRQVIAHLIGSSLPDVPAYEIAHVESGSSYKGTEREVYQDPVPDPDSKPIGAAEGPFAEPLRITPYQAACLSGVDPNTYDCTRIRFRVRRSFETLELAFSNEELRLAGAVAGSFTEDADMLPPNTPPTSLLKACRLFELGFRYTGHLQFVRGDHSGRYPRGVRVTMGWC